MTRVLTTNQPDAEGFELRSNNAGNFLTRVEDFDSNWIVDAYAAALAVTDWYLDAVTGNDQNDGLTPATALQSGIELQRRLGPQARWTASVTVHIGTGGVQSLCLRGETAAAGVSVDIIGTPTLVADAGTVSAYTAMDHATPRSPTLTCTGVTDWTPYVGMRVRLTSGANAGACTWILKANAHGLGANVARTSVWYKKNDVVPTTSLASTVTPVIGDAITIDNLPLIENLDIELFGIAALPGGNAWPQRQYAIESLLITSLNRSASSDKIDLARSVVFGCRLSFQNNQNRFFSAFTSAPVYASLLWSATNSQLLLGGSFSGIGTLNVSALTAVSSGSLVLTNCVLQATSLSTVYCSSFINGLQIFDVIGAAVPAFNVWNSYAANVSGDNNAGYGYVLLNRSNCTLAGTQNLKGAVANVLIGSAVMVSLPLTITMASLLPINDFARSGTAKLVAGTVTVTVPYTDWTVQRLTFGRSTPFGPTLGNLSTPTASRTTTSFVISSSSITETSDVEWFISPLGRNIFVANAI